MTRYGWDASDYDHDRGPMDMAKAHAEGIDLFTHKISEGTGYRTRYGGPALANAQRAGIPVLGGYHVLYPKTMQSIEAQANWFLASLDAVFAAWRKHPCFVLQVDAEKFQYMPREPSRGEILTFAKLLAEKAKVLPTQVAIYGPHWLYGDKLHDIRRHPLWASSYVEGAGGFKSLYPGDHASQWDAYGGEVPDILQYNSTATIAGQHPSDANAIRVDTVGQLKALFIPEKKEDDEMTMSKEVEQRFEKLEAETKANGEKLDTLLGLFKRVDDKGGPRHLPHLLETALKEHDEKRRPKP